MSRQAKRNDEAADIEEVEKLKALSPDTLRIALRLIREPADTAGLPLTERREAKRRFDLIKRLLKEKRSR